MHLCDFAHNGLYRTTRSYDETIDYSHILLENSMHGSTLDRFVLSQAVNDYKKSFLDKQGHVEQCLEAVDFVIYVYFTKTHTYQTE